MVSTVSQAQPLLDFIRKYEAGKAGYNAIWLGISRKHHPPKPLTSMTIGQVLAWQDSIDHLYMSEACGGYQFMEATLRDIYSRAGFTPDAPFNAKTQDELAVYLLKRRGLTDYLRGDMSLNTFAIQVAKEWASMPVPVRVKGHKGFTLSPGQSYYSGDGLNSTHVPVRDFLEAISACKKVDPRRVRPESDISRTQIPEALEDNVFAAIVATISSFFNNLLNKSR